jgi:hypothetical protein
MIRQQDDTICMIAEGPTMDQGLGNVQSS